MARRDMTITAKVNCRQLNRVLRKAERLNRTLEKAYELMNELDGEKLGVEITMVTNTKRRRGWLR